MIIPFIFSLVIALVALLLIAAEQLSSFSFRPADHFTYMDLIGGGADIDNVANTAVVFIYRVPYELFGIWGIYILNLIAVTIILVFSYRLLDRDAYVRFYVCVAPILFILVPSVQREIPLALGSVFLLHWLLNGVRVTNSLLGVVGLTAMLVRPIYGAIFLYHIALRFLLFRTLIGYCVLIIPIYIYILNDDYYYAENISRLSSAVDNSSAYLGGLFLANHQTPEVFITMVAYNFTMNMFGGVLSFVRNFNDNILLNPIGFGNLFVSVLLGIELLKSIRCGGICSVYMKSFLSLVLFVSTASWVWGPRYIFPFLILPFIANSRLKLKRRSVAAKKESGRVSRYREKSHDLGLNTSRNLT